MEFLLECRSAVERKDMPYCCQNILMDSLRTQRPVNTRMTVSISAFFKHSAHKVFVRQVSLVKDGIWMHRCTVAQTRSHYVIHRRSFSPSILNGPPSDVNEAPPSTVLHICFLLSLLYSPLSPPLKVSLTNFLSSRLLAAQHARKDLAKSDPTWRGASASFICDG